MSVAIRINLSQLDPLNDRLAMLAHLPMRELFDELGAEGESQTRRRIQEEKSAPDGTPWPAWSDAYAKTRHGGQSLLQSEGDLLDSIQFIADDRSAEIGSDLIYARRQNDGDGETGTGIPARTYLGFSEENINDFKYIVDDFLQRQLETL